MHLRDLNAHDLAIVPLIGSPVSAAVAPTVYNQVFDHYGVQAVSAPVEITVDQLPEFLAAARLLRLPGTVLTAPLKSAVVDLLDEVDPISSRFRSVNAIRIRDGRTHGRGMDGAGVVGALDAAGVELRGARVLMLGAGGVGGVFAAEMAARGISELTVLNRTVDRARAVVEAVEEMFDVTARADSLSPDTACAAAEGADVVLQATSVGSRATGEDWEDLSFVARLPADACVLEAVSNPPRTALVRAAEERGLRTLAGIEMMVEQVRAMFSFLLDVELPAQSRDVARAGFTRLFGQTA